jgi:hypothetical protein
MRCGLHRVTIGAADALTDWCHVVNLVDGCLRAIDVLAADVDERCRRLGVGVGVAGAGAGGGSATGGGRQGGAGGHAFFVSDGEPLNTFEFLRPLAAALGCDAGVVDARAKQSAQSKKQSTQDAMTRPSEPRSEARGGEARGGEARGGEGGVTVVSEATWRQTRRQLSLALSTASALRVARCAEVVHRVTRGLIPPVLTQAEVLKVQPTYNDNPNDQNSDRPWV